MNKRKQENTFVIFCWSILIGLIIFQGIILVAATDIENIKLYETTNLHFICTTNGEVPSPGATYNITVSYPNGTLFIDNKQTTALGNGAFSYTTKFTQTGLYRVQMFCWDGIYSFSGEGFYNVIPTGIPPSSFLNNPILLILGLLGLVLCIVGATKGIPWFGFIGSIMFLLVGIYTMIYGFDNVTNFYTQGAALVFIGMGIIFMMLSAYEWISDSDDENNSEEEDD